MSENFGINPDPCNRDQERTNWGRLFRLLDLLGNAISIDDETGAITITANIIVVNNIYVDNFYNGNGTQYCVDTCTDPSTPPDTLLNLDGEFQVYNVGTTPATDGQTIVTWVDQSPAGVSYTGSGLNKPTFKAIDASLNNEPSVAFDGTQYMQYGTPNITNNSGVLFAVIHIVTNATEGTLLGTSSSSGLTSLQVGPYYNSTNPKPFMKLLSAGQTRVSYGSSSLSNGGDYLLTFISDGSTHRIRVNGVEETVSSVNSPNGFWFDDALGNNYTVGALVGTSETDNFNGRIGNLLVYPNMSNTQIAAIETSLMTEFGLP